MTNYEKYKDEIIKFLTARTCGATRAGKINWCDEIGCQTECVFYFNGRCRRELEKWLNAEIPGDKGDITEKPANTIKMLMAKHPDENKARAWNIPEGMTVPGPGNYAIVENLNGYALVEVIGTCEVAKDKTHLLTGHRGGVSKDVIKFILKSELKKGG